MEKIFGLPMGRPRRGARRPARLLLVPVVATIVFQRVMFRIGIRNIPRRRAQTILIVLGLMLSTLIMSSALGFGDSLNYSIKKGVYDRLGPVDETLAIEDAAAWAPRARSPRHPSRKARTGRSPPGSRGPPRSMATSRASPARPPCISAGAASPAPRSWACRTTRRCKHSGRRTARRSPVSGPARC
jgi:hypothetical protein